MTGQTPEHIQRARIVKALREKQGSLDLSNLRLTSLWEGLWQLTHLTSLDLSGNNLAVLPVEIGQLTNLISLTLSFNQLASLPVELCQLVNLNSLNLRNNHLSAIPNEIGQLTRLTWLDISKNRLDSTLQPEIGQLTELTSLDLSDNQLAKLPDEIGQLENLTLLDLAYNDLSTLPCGIGQLSNLDQITLAHNQLDNLPVEIGQLINLTSLDLSENGLVAVPAEIGQLTSLANLDISSNDLVTLPAEIKQLVNLTFLDISFNYRITLPTELWQITSLSSLNLSGIRMIALPVGIGQITNLKQLLIHGNQLTTLPAEIGRLIKLEKLILSNRIVGGITPGNKIGKLPFEIQNLKALKELDLRDNDLNIPPEILERINEPQVILNYYFENRIKPLNEVKVILIGQGSVGKTSLVQRFVFCDFKSNQTKTDGISISKWRVVPGSQPENLQSLIQLNIWDFGGQEIMHATHQFFLTKRSLYLLVLDARLTQEENRIEYWLKITQSFGGESPVLIVGNKTDQHPLDIDRTGLQKKYPNIVGIIETSAATGAGIEELKAALTEQVNNLPHVHDLLPETWFTVKTKLEELGRGSNFITHDDYDKLCNNNDVNDEVSQHTLIGFLHDLGVVLYFQDDPRLESLGILNPQWVTNGVYKILNSHVLFQNKGVLTVAMLDEILNLPEYPRGKRLFIVDMMKKFELCYDIEPDKTFLVPDLFPKDEPQLTFNGVPAFEYAYPVLPSSVITHFIVRMNQKIDDGLVWRTGVVLKIGENHALVKADIEDKKITIAIDGLEHTRRDALSAIRYQLDEIHASIKGLNPQKMVPIPNAPNAEPVDYEYLLMLERDGQEIYSAKDGNRLVKVHVRQLLSGVENEAQRRDSTSKVTNIYVGGNFDGSMIVGDDNDSRKN